VIAINQEKIVALPSEPHQPMPRWRADIAAFQRERPRFCCQAGTVGFWLVAVLR